MAAPGRSHRAFLAPKVPKHLGIVPIRQNGQERPFFGMWCSTLLGNQLPHRMPQKWPFLAILTDRGEPYVFWDLKSESITLRTAGRSRWDLCSHPDPVLFTALTPHVHAQVTLRARLHKLRHSRATSSRMMMPTSRWRKDRR